MFYERPSFPTGSTCLATINLLKRLKCLPSNSPAMPPTIKNTLHVSFVVAADLLDPDIVLGLDVRLGGGVGPCQSHHAGDVLEVLLVFDFNLQERRHLLAGS